MSQDGSEYRVGDDTPLNLARVGALAFDHADISAVLESIEQSATVGDAIVLIIGYWVDASLSNELLDECLDTLTERFGETGLEKLYRVVLVTVTEDIRETTMGARFLLAILRLVGDQEEFSLELCVQYLIAIWEGGRSFDILAAGIKHVLTSTGYEINHPNTETITVIATILDVLLSDSTIPLARVFNVLYKALSIRMRARVRSGLDSLSNELSNLAIALGGDSTFDNPLGHTLIGETTQGLIARGEHHLPEVVDWLADRYGIKHGQAGINDGIRAAVHVSQLPRSLLLRKDLRRAAGNPEIGMDQLRRVRVGVVSAGSIVNPEKHIPGFGSRRQRPISELERLAIDIAHAGSDSPHLRAYLPLLREVDVAACRRLEATGDDGRIEIEYRVLPEIIELLGNGYIDVVIVTLEAGQLIDGARMITQRLGNKVTKPVICTGASLPWDAPATDAAGNISIAAVVARLESLTAQVLVVMGARVLPAWAARQRECNPGELVRIFEKGDKEEPGYSLADPYYTSEPSKDWRLESTEMFGLHNENRLKQTAVFLFLAGGTITTSRVGGALQYGHYANPLSELRSLEHKTLLQQEALAGLVQSGRDEPRLVYEGGSEDITTDDIEQIISEMIRAIDIHRKQIKVGNFRIVMAMGTDSMVEVGRYIAVTLTAHYKEGIPCPIFITGANRSIDSLASVAPAGGLTGALYRHDTDAFDNLSRCFLAAQQRNLPNDVYIVLEGRPVAAASAIKTLSFGDGGLSVTDRDKPELDWHVRGLEDIADVNVALVERASGILHGANKMEPKGARGEGSGLIRFLDIGQQSCAVGVRLNAPPNPHQKLILDEFVLADSPVTAIQVDLYHSFSASRLHFHDLQALANPKGVGSPRAQACVVIGASENGQNADPLEYETTRELFFNGVWPALCHPQTARLKLAFASAMFTKPIDVLRCYYRQLLVPPEMYEPDLDLAELMNLQATILYQDTIFDPDDLARFRPRYRGEQFDIEDTKQLLHGHWKAVRRT
jgi:L-asparaginase/Glu-tRNA(Gln) amidotransferase subunit D